MGAGGHEKRVLRRRGSGRKGGPATPSTRIPLHPRLLSVRACAVTTLCLWSPNPPSLSSSSSITFWPLWKILCFPSWGSRGLRLGSQALGPHFHWKGSKREWERGKVEKGGGGGARKSAGDGLGCSLREQCRKRLGGPNNPGKTGDTPSLALWEKEGGTRSGVSGGGGGRW